MILSHVEAKGMKNDIRAGLTGTVSGSLIPAIAEGITSGVDADHALESVVTGLWWAYYDGGVSGAELHSALQWIADYRADYGTEWGDNLAYLDYIA